MLREREKQRIRQEEILRAEVRSQLEKKIANETKGGRLWGFLNSSFGIWLLSTIAVGGITWCYNEFQKDILEEKFKYEQATKIFLEVENRLTEFELSLFRLKFKSDKDLGQVFSDFKKPSSESPSVVFPEYANRSTTSLLLDLERFLPDNNKNKELIDSCLTTMGMVWIEETYLVQGKDLLSKGELEKNNKEVERSIKHMANDLRERLKKIKNNNGF